MDRKGFQGWRIGNWPAGLAIVTGIVMALGLAGCQTCRELFRSRGSVFSLVVMPDTQNYTDASFGGQAQYFYDQTEWIKQNRRRLNIVMVAHAGDIVQNPGERSEWDIADRAFRTIDHEVPYIVCLGNHDIADEQGAGTNPRHSFANEYFPPARFTENPVYSGNFGADPQTHFMEPGEIDNYYLYFTGGGRQFLIIAREFKPCDDTLAWAGRVIRAHPYHHCVVLTHGYLKADNTRGMGHYAIEGNAPQEIWDKLISRHPNIFLVLCGHALGETVLTSTGRSGHTVHQVLADFQNDYIGAGGNGYLRIMTFDTRKREIRIQTYSPSLDTYLTREKSQFTLAWD